MAGAAAETGPEPVPRASARVAHFSMRALMAAPIILGNDIRTMSDQTHAILTNEEVMPSPPAFAFTDSLGSS